MKKIIAATFVLMILFSRGICAFEPTLSCESAVLMCANTGEVLYSLNKDVPLAPASVTKIMTLLIIMEKLEEGSISYDSAVTASERAKSMGGSTIYLDAGEEMTVRDLIKGICVASANDACVAMAEYISGSEEAFVAEMNKRAEELGMKNTHFVNTNGLDAPGHQTSAFDIALMSKELLGHREIISFTTIWTDSLRNGAFELANTNRLIRFYDGATGLKTGSTSGAGCCISATAEKNGMSLIAVVMKAPSSTERFGDARTLLDYGFNNFVPECYDDLEAPVGTVTVCRGEKEKVGAVLSAPLYALSERGVSEALKLKIVLDERIEAPVEKGAVIGRAELEKNGKSVCECNLVAAEDVKRKSLGKVYLDMFRLLISPRV